MTPAEQREFAAKQKALRLATQEQKPVIHLSDVLNEDKKCKDRHSPGYMKNYMRLYMRAYRAKKKQGAEHG